jgi:branched-chain amino acid transport system substrate-binding protein
VQPYDSSIDSPANKAFVEAYKKKSGGTLPIMVGFESYEATRILIDAIKRAGSTEPAAVRDALTKTKYESILGTTLEFDQNNLLHNNAVILGIRDGKVVVFGYSKT